jgi:hypothetical protein
MPDASAVWTIPPLPELEAFMIEGIELLLCDLRIRHEQNPVVSKQSHVHLLRLGN